MSLDREPHSFSSTSTSLIARVRIGDQAAWSRLVDLYAPLIYFWCRRARLNGPDASDLVQEILAKVLSGIDRFRHDGPGSTFRGWLWTITRNALTDHARARENRAEAAGGTEARERLQQIPDSNIDETTRSLSAGQSDLVRRAFALIRNEFNAASLKAFQLTVFDNHTAREAGQAVGMTPAAVRQVKTRILRRLREELGDAGG